MNKLIVPMALAMFSVSMASAAFADGANGKGQGFENSGNDSACLNAGAGNGGEFVGLAGVRGCGRTGNEAAIFKPLDEDPGNSQTNNNAPQVPPGHPKK
jgi:hypothetical protein